MKKTLLLFLFTFCLLNLSAQLTFNRAYHSGSETANSHLVQLNGDFYFTSNFQYMSSILYRISSTGVLKSKTNLGFPVAVDMVKTNDGKLAIAGYQVPCDVIYPQPNVVCKLDTNGNQLFSSSYASAAGSSPTAFLQYADSGYFSFTSTELIKHNKNGLATISMTTGLSGIKAALLLANNNLLLSANVGSVTSLVQLSSTGSVVASKPFPVLLNRLVYYNGQKVMGLGNDGKLYKISPSLDLISTSSFTATVVRDFATSNDSVYCLASLPNSNQGYMITDTLFNTLYVGVTAAGSGVSHSAVGLLDSRVAVLSTCLSRIVTNGFETQYFVALSTVAKASAVNYTTDLTLLSVQADSSYLSCNVYTVASPAATVCTAMLRPKIKVKNSGSTAIQSFKLNCYNTPNMFCGGAYFYQEQFSGFTLMPGDSIILTAHSFAPRYLDIVSTPSPVVNYCFYTTVPNNETDKTRADNESCNSFAFAITTGLKEFQAPGVRLEIYPNPFKEMLHVEASVTIRQIEITDALGRVVTDLSVNDTNTDLNQSDLPAGLYFLKVNTDKGSAIKKLIKN